MCMTCVAQGGPYLVGSVVALRAMTTSSRRRRLAREAAGAPAVEHPADDAQPAVTR